MRSARLFSLAALVAIAIPSTLSAAGPNPSEVYVESISYGGTGCPQGTVGQSISDDRSTMTLIFDSYVASSGPGVPVTESRKACQVNINLHLPQGFQVSIGTVDYRGYVQLPAGVTATQQATYSFQGASSKPARSAFTGPVAKDYLLHDELPFESLVWSACNAVAPVNIKTAVTLTGPPSSAAQITNDSIDGKVTHILGLQWKAC